MSQPAKKLRPVLRKQFKTVYSKNAKMRVVVLLLKESNKYYEYTLTTSIQQENPAIVNCLNFSREQSLFFQANYSATSNVLINVGQPKYRLNDYLGCIA